MPPQPQQPQRPLTLAERIQIGQNLSAYPAMTLMVFLRKDLGYRLVSLPGLFGTAFVMILVAPLFAPESQPNALILFAMVMVVMGLKQRIARWQEHRRGAVQHSYYIGTSIFDSPKFPKVMRRRRRIARYFDPLVCGLIGAALLPVAKALAVWIIFSAICLRAYEHAIFRREFMEQLDLMDTMIQADTHANIVEQFSETPEDRNNSADATNVIPTGLGNDIQHKVKRNKKI